MPKLGLNAVCYFKTTGVDGAGEWQPITAIKDLSLNIETGEADITTRGANGWRLKIATLAEAGIEGELLWDSADASFNALKNAFFGKRLIGILALDGPITEVGNEGLRCDASVLSFTRDESLEEALSVKFKLAPSLSTTPPHWVRVQTPGILVIAEG
jgi:hypothetical protein